MSNNTVDLTVDHLENLNKAPLTRADLVRILRSCLEKIDSGAGPQSYVANAIINHILQSVLEDSVPRLRDELRKELEAATPKELVAMRSGLLGARSPK